MIFLDNQAVLIRGSLQYDPKTLLVKINTSKWIYSFKDGEMILGQSYVDGPNLVFKKE
jgi:hypothetical protein